MREPYSVSITRFIYLYFDTVVDQAVTEGERVDQIIDMVCAEFPDGGTTPSADEVIIWWLEAAHPIEDAEHHLWCLDTIDEYDAAGNLAADAQYIGIRKGLASRELHQSALERVRRSFWAFETSVARPTS